MRSIQFLALLAAVAVAGANEAVHPRLIELTDTNFITYRGQVNGVSASKFIDQLATKFNETEVYVFLTTPGGDVMAGMQIVQAINALDAYGVNVTCISDIAISMGFVITQYCPHRLVMDSSILMQHQMSLQLGNQLANFKSHLGALEKYDNSIKTHEAARLGMTNDDYKRAIHDDWWIYGAESIDVGAADELVHVYCNLTSNKPEITILQSWFGDFELGFSKCPLARSPLFVREKREYNNSTCENEYSTNNVPKNVLIKMVAEEFYGGYLLDIGIQI